MSQPSPATAATIAPPHPAACAADAMLAQCAQLLKELSQELYARPSQRFFGSTIGQHVRHSLDHVAAALCALDDEVIDYDTRRRGGSVEHDRDAALQAIDAVRAELRAIDAERADRAVRVRVMLTAEGDFETLNSTLARELAFAAHHEIHHHAMMASIAGEHGVATPPGFGKAPSTSNHERRSK